MDLRLVDAELAIPEHRIVVFSPHFDDVACMLAGWLLAMQAAGSLEGREFLFIVLFSLSNYTARAGEANYDSGTERVRQATGTRLLEDIACLDELVGPHRYRYELGLEKECLLRGGRLSDPEFEFPHGTYEDFDAEDWAILARIESRAGELLAEGDTALVVPAAYREHKDHFIAREAARLAYAKAKEAGRLSASLYFLEDKPYAGLADAAESARVMAFAEEDQLNGFAYRVDSLAVAGLVQRFYPSQFEEIYRTGIVGRGRDLARKLGLEGELDAGFCAAGKPLAR
jgi:hypothetical protein